MENKDTRSLVPAQRAQNLLSPQKRQAVLVQAFLSNRNPNTLRNYEKAIEDFKVFLGADTKEEAVAQIFGMPQGEANALALAYKAELVEQGLASNTVNLRLAAIRSMGKLARILGLVPWTLEVENLKVQSYRDTAGPGKEAILKVLQDLAQKTDPMSVRDKAIIRLLYSCALRRKEVAGLNIDDYEPQTGKLWILGKARTDQEPISVPPNARLLIEEWMKVRKPGPGPLFKNFDPSGKGGERLSDKGVYRIVKKYGLGHTHGLRHSAITEALDKGLDMRSVQRFSRHKNFNTVLIYDDNRKDLGGEVARLLDEEK